jgi:hypothetical protein
MAAIEIYSAKCKGRRHIPCQPDPAVFLAKPDQPLNLRHLQLISSHPE